MMYNVADVVPTLYDALMLYNVGKLSYYRSFVFATCPGNLMIFSILVKCAIFAPITRLFTFAEI